MLRIAGAVWISVMLGSAAPAVAGFTAANRLTVVEDGARGFFVPYGRSLSAASDYWCAAGDFAIRAMKLSPSTRIYRVSPPPIRGAGVRFSLDGTGAVASGMNVFGSKDSSISASMAQQYCRSLQQDRFRDR